MASVRILKLEILGCALLLAVTIGVLLKTPDAPWAGRDANDSVTPGRDLVAPPVADSPSRSVVPALPPPPPKPPPAHLTGRLVLIDDAGAEHDDRSGTLYLTIDAPGLTPEVHRIAVDHGRFEVDAYVGCSLAAETASIDGAYASVDLPRTPLPESRELVVTARVPRKFRVHVTDAATNEELPDVALRVATGAGWLFPAELERLETWTRPGASPREVAADLPAHDVWIDAEGYGFVRIAIAPGQGGDVTVPLARAATLRIQLTGAPPPKDLVLRFTDDADPPRVLQELTSDRPMHRFDRLTPRKLVVIATAPSRGSNELARAAIELTPERITDVVLDLAP